MPSGSSLFNADCEDPALDILARSHGLWTARSGGKENHKEERAKSKSGANYNLYSLCAAWSRSVQGKGIWTVGVKLALRKETGKMIF